MEGSNPVKSFGPAKGLNASKYFDRIRFRDVAGLIGAVAVLIFVIGVSSVSYRLHKESTEALDNHARVEENSELTYYLTVNEDGVDSTGKQSSDTVTANISGGMTSITDRLPDGLEFVGFVTTEDGTIGAAGRSDSSVACGGHVIDDTEEETVNAGTWNAAHTEYYYHGLHYNAETRTVSFRVENVQAGCGLTVGIITHTPTLGNNKRLDFYNTATLNEGILNLNSNTMHTWMGRNGLTDYSVTYSYTGTVPDNAPSAPEEQKYVDGADVEIAPSPIVEGYQFSGWTTSDTETELGRFTMPASNVAFTGSFTASTAQKYSVTYVIDGDAPADYVMPKTKQYAAGSTVLLDATRKGNQIDDYTFEGWTSEDVDLDETGFVMPSQDIEIHGTFTRTTFSVTYAFQGDILPPNADSLLPETKEYPAGAKVTREANPEAEGYRFTGWYKNETFIMPAENVTIYGEWSQVDGVFTPELSIKTMGEPKKYMLGDTVMFEIEVKNTAEYPIKDVQILEQMEGAVFTEGEGYTLKTDTYALVDEIPAGGSVKVYAEYKLEEDTEDTFTNTVVLTGAIADGNYALDTSRDYTASVDFETQYYVGPEEKEEQEKEAENAKTLDRIASYVIVAITGLAGIIASIFMVMKTLKNDQFQGVKGTIQKTSRIKDFFNPNAATKGRLIAFATADLALVAVAAGLIVKLNLPQNLTENADPTTISFMSSRANYDTGEGGAWKITKSAKWTGDGEAELKIDVDTIAKTADNRHTDILYVVDVSESMEGDRLDKVKRDMSELTESLLSIDGNRVAMVSFDTGARKELDFTGDEETALSAIDNLTPFGSTNYYQALKKAGELLETYEHSDDTELIMLFLTDGYPNQNTPNERAEYAYLKDTYPYMTVNAIQYEMDREVLETVRAISDAQYIASMDTLNNVLFEASIAPYTYSEFTVEDVMSEYFFLDNTAEIESIVPSLGTAELSEQDGLQKITWKMDGLIRSGTSQSLTIKIKIQDAYKRVGGEYPTNTGESVSSKIEGVRDESVESDETPVLRSNYYVRYEANAPSDCTPVGVPEGQAEHFVYEVVEIESNVPTCTGYNFNGWAITTSGIKKLNDDYFRMPGQDVTFRATWTKANIQKTVDGTVHEEVTATLDTGQTVNVKMKKLSGVSDATTDSWGSSITGIERADSLPAEIDASNSDNVISSPSSLTPIIAWFNNRTLYYYTDAEVVVMNEDSSYLFKRLSSVVNIDTVSDWDTSKMTNMRSMFESDVGLRNIDGVTNWDTSNVTDMGRSFFSVTRIANINALANWNTSSVLFMDEMFSINATSPQLSDISGVTNWDTSNVTTMKGMFEGITALYNISALANWNVSKVEDMSYMFYRATNLANISGATNWNTSSVTNMSNMFYNAKKLTNIDGASNWDTSKVTNMSNMFNGATSLAGVNGASNWDTSKVEDMSYMFNGATSLTNISGASRWNTGSVTDMRYMFFGDSALSNISGARNWNTSSLTEVKSMFENATSLTGISALANWDVSKVVSLERLFCGATRLTNISGASGWNTGNVTNMSHTFLNTALVGTDALANWDTSKVTTMYNLFAGVSTLSEINGLANWNTLSVRDLTGIFSSASMTSLDPLANWNTSSVELMVNSFYNVENIADIDALERWDTSEVTTMYGMFYKASSLANIDGASNWDTSKVTNMQSMFQDATSLNDISGASNWNTSSVENMAKMFAFDSSITDLSPLNNWNTSSLADRTSMFYDIPSSVTRPTWY